MRDDRDAGTSGERTKDVDSGRSNSSAAKAKADTPAASPAIEGREATADDQLITQAEAARILGTNPVRVLRMIERGELPAVDVPTTVKMLPRGAVERMAPLGAGKPGRRWPSKATRDSRPHRPDPLTS